jgi:hypothetical protein
VSQNRIVELRPALSGAEGPDWTQSVSQPVGFKRPFTSFYTATWRAGSAPSNVIDIYGTRAGEENTLSYARIRIR